MDPNISDKQNVSTRLPEEVRTELFRSEVFDTYREIASQYGAPQIKVGTLAGLVLQMLGGVFLPGDFAQRISDKLGIDQTVSEKIAQDIFTKVLLQYREKIPWFDFGAVEATEAISVQKNPEQFADKYVGGLFGTQDIHAAHRLRSIFLSLIDGQTTPEAAIERMQRPLKLDGLELDESDASGIIETFVEKARAEGFMEEKEEKIELAPPPVVKKEVQAEPVTVPKGTKPRIDAFTAEDAKEIEKHIQEKKAVIELPSVRSVEDVVKQVCEHGSFTFDDPSLKDRCAKLVEARVREVRGPSDTRRKIEMPPEQGGLGITGRRLSEMTQHLEQTVQAYLDQATEKVAEDKKVGDKVKQILVEDSEARARKEEQIMNKRYAAMTGLVPRDSIAPVGPKQTRTSVAIAAHIETQQRERKIDTEKLRSVIEKTKESAVSEPPRRPPVQPKVADIISSKRLSGPTEELGHLTLIDFRRLSKDPTVAITKIKDQIDLLENRGYEMKIVGIKAWRQSPVNQIYMKLAETAVLSGVPLQEALAQAHGAGEDTLTNEELKAIMKLNADLRF